MQLAPDDDFIGITDDIAPEVDNVYAGQYEDDDDDALLGYGTYLGYEPAEILGASRLRKRLRKAFRKLGKRIKGRFRKIGKRIKARIRKRRGQVSSKARKFLEEGLQLTTPEGTATLGPEGVDWTSAEAAAAAQAMPAEGGIVGMVKRNPLLVALPLGAVALVMFMRRR